MSQIPRAGIAVLRAEETGAWRRHLSRSLSRGRLAGERGEQREQTNALGVTTLAIIRRPYLIDELIKAELQRGAGLVINLAEGLIRGTTD